jgi:antitoxin MazE
MKVALVRIGNSRGIRIPKPVIRQCGFSDMVEMTVEDNRVVIAPHVRARQGWGEAFRDAGGGFEGDESLLAGAGRNEFDRDEWWW